MIKALALFFLGFLLIAKGGDWFVDSASNIARHFHISELLIGATIVSIGTTLPEVMVSVDAAVKGSSGISFGNAIGSVICNTSLIAALTIAVRPQTINRNSLKLPVSFFFEAAIFYLIFAWTGREFKRWQGFILLGIFVCYMIATIFYVRRIPDDNAGSDPAVDEVQTRVFSVHKEIALLVISAVIIAVGSDLLVDNATYIAGRLHVPDIVIGLTAIAIGTSLPELVTAVNALLKGHSALSLGNIIGANLFNIVLVSGLSISIAPFRIPLGNPLLGISSSLIIDLPVMMAVMCILCIPALIKGKLYRAQGITLLIIYVLYFASQVISPSTAAPPPMPPAL